jgi:hypothetical protein
MGIRFQSNPVTVSPTNGSANAILIPEMTFSFTLEKTAPILIMFSGTFSNSNNNQGAIVTCVIDGVSKANMQRTTQEGGAGNNSTITTQGWFYLCPGSHTISMFFVATANTATAAGIERSLTIIEEEL